MLIKDWMTRSPVTIDCDASLNDAAKLFRTRAISMLPVVYKGRLEGVVTNGDTKRAMPSDATTLDRYALYDLLEHIKLKDIMSSPPITITQDVTVDQAAHLMLSSGISGLPVMTEDNTLEGIITKSDVFRCFVSFTGVAKNGHIFGFRVKDTPGVIQTLVKTIGSFGGRLSSILTSYGDEKTQFRTVYFHTYGILPDRFETLVTEFYSTGELVYAADLSRDLKQIY